MFLIFSFSHFLIFLFARGPLFSYFYYFLTFLFTRGPLFSHVLLCPGTFFLLFARGPLFCYFLIFFFFLFARGPLFSQFLIFLFSYLPVDPFLFHYFLICSGTLIFAFSFVF